MALFLGILASSACAPVGPISGAVPEVGDVQIIQNKGSDTILNLVLAGQRPTLLSAEGLHYCDQWRFRDRHRL